MAIEAGQKVQVVSAYGSSPLGEMDPKLNLVTDRGTITAINLPVVEVSGAGVTAITPYYPGTLQVLTSNATSGYSWPSGDGSIVYGHRGVFMSGVPLATPTVSAVIMQPTNATYVFTR